VEYRASQGLTGQSFLVRRLKEARRKPQKHPVAVPENWHARAVVDGQVAAGSMCGLVEWSEESTLSWDSPAVNRRCAACANRVDHPSPYGDDDLWHKNGFDANRLCVVCSTPAAGVFTGPHAMLSVRHQHGAVQSVASKVVAVHQRCVAEAEAIALEQGYEWTIPPHTSPNSTLVSGSGRSRSVA
jgi:hypothetical protein